MFVGDCGGHPGEGPLPLGGASPASDSYPCGLKPYLL